MAIYRVTKLVVEYVEASNEDQAFEYFCSVESELNDSIDIEQVDEEWIILNEIEVLKIDKNGNGFDWETI